MDRDGKHELTLLGYPARLVIELPGGEHDVSHMLEAPRVGEVSGATLWPSSGGWAVDFHALAIEVEVELRARERAREAVKS